MRLKRFCYEYANYIKHSLDGINTDAAQKIKAEKIKNVDHVIKMAENGLICTSELMHILNKIDIPDFYK